MPAVIAKRVPVGLVLTMLSLVTHAEVLTGEVVVLDNGQGLAQAAVVVTFPDRSAGPRALTVFTSREGLFHLPMKAVPEPRPVSLANAEFSVRKLGYEHIETTGTFAIPTSDSSAAHAAPLTLYVKPTGDIAHQVPASAWLAAGPPGDHKNITITSCSSCHQLASPRFREYAADIEAVRGGPQGDAEALEEWRKVVRHEAWRAAVRYMRSMHYSVFPLESTMNLDAIDWPTAQNADNSFFSERQGEIVAQYLTDHFPRSTASLPRGSYTHGAPLGVTDKTLIREYAFPDDALVRELVPAPDTPYLWGADVRRNQIVRLNPATGATRWFQVDFDGATGPHTIVPDDTGRLWVSMIDNDQFGVFNPNTEQWRLWTLHPSNLTDASSIAGAAIVHDMSIDSRAHLARANMGNIWLTIVGTNQMGTIHPDTGAVAFHDTNRIDGLSAINHLLYATVLPADGNCAWYSQVNGWVGCINTRTHQIERLIEFQEGSGPRRMARDNQGHLWVALFGSGEVAKIDMASGRLLATWPLPDRSAAPYSVTWDQRRECVWVVNANSDAIYRLDPHSGQATVYPLPRQMAYMRQLAVNQNTGQLVGTYGNYPEGSGPSMGVLIDVGD